MATFDSNSIRQCELSNIRQLIFEVLRDDECLLSKLVFKCFSQISCRITVESFNQKLIEPFGVDIFTETLDSKQSRFD